MKNAALDRAAGNRLQDAFLGATRGQPMTLFLVNGVRLQGAIIAEDKHSILMVREHMMQLVYKHAISTAVPLDAVQIPAVPITDTPTV